MIRRLSKKAIEICQSKRVYFNLRKGWHVAAEVFIWYGTIVSPYHCNVCGKYHLTSKKTTAPEIYFKQIEVWLGVRISEEEEDMQKVVWRGESNSRMHPRGNAHPSGARSLE